MKKNIVLYLNTFLLSAVVLCFEITATRISSVIFVNDYAFIIVSLALLGLGSGGIFSVYGVKKVDPDGTVAQISRTLAVLGAALLLFIIAVCALSLTLPAAYFLLLFIPFFLAGIVYAQIYTLYADNSFRLYAADLAGGAVGSVASLGFITAVGAPNSIAFLAAIILIAALNFSSGKNRPKNPAGYALLVLALVGLSVNGKHEFMGSVPIGNFEEKDYYHVYPNAASISTTMDSRWSIYGRSDFIRYSNQDIVRQMFIDGSAGSQMYRFDGDLTHTQPLLFDLLLQHSNSIPLLFLDENEKKSMLIIGPGGGKEVLLGMFNRVKNITAVEINPDFVALVKDHKEFNGGIYTDFPNVHVLVQEGRHYIKRSQEKVDVIMMALPSTEQMQSIEPFAMSENYLLTVEAIKDYVHLLTPEGRMIFTVHNTWELVRLIMTSVAAFQELGVDDSEMPNHFAVLDAEYAPTIVIKKTAFTKDEAAHWRDRMKLMPKNLPPVTYVPYSDALQHSRVNAILSSVVLDKGALRKYIDNDRYDITPCRDDKPYFYNDNRGVPGEYLWLLGCLAIVNACVVWVPLTLIRKNAKKDQRAPIGLAVTIFLCLGLGFMILEVSLFQKFILFLGSSTVSLSILLSSLLIGMGIGSFRGKHIFSENITKRIAIVCAAIAVSGVFVFLLSPVILTQLLSYSLIVRCAASFVIILPFGFLVGIPFPSCIQLLRQGNMDSYIPWMYGVNGAMSVLGSVLAVIVSMLYGFTPTFFVGLSFYIIIPVLVVAYGKMERKA